VKPNQSSKNENNIKRYDLTKKLKSQSKAYWTLNYWKIFVSFEKKCYFLYNCCISSKFYQKCLYWCLYLIFYVLFIIQFNHWFFYLTFFVDFMILKMDKIGYSSFYIQFSKCLSKKYIILLIMVSHNYYYKSINLIIITL